MSPLVRIFKDVHIKIMTSQTQPVQATRSIQKSFFTVPFRSCSETPKGATGAHDAKGERGVWVMHPGVGGWRMGDAAPSSTCGLPHGWEQPA